MSFPFDLTEAELRRRRSAKWSLVDPDVLPLPVAEMDVRLAPAIAAVLAAALADSDTGYPGDAHPMFEAFAAFAGRRWRWQVDPARMAMAPDVAAAVVAVLRQVVRPGAGVVICPPVYPPFFAWLPEAGAATVEVPLLDAGHGWRLDLDGIEQALRHGARAVLLANPHNPTGRCHDLAELQALAGLAAETGAVVLSDEIHGPLTHPGHNFHPYLSVSPEAAATGVAFVSASKAWNVAGLMCAQVVADAEHAALVGRLGKEGGAGVGHLGVLAAQAAYADTDDWLDLLVVALADRATHLRSLLAERLPGVSWSSPDAGFLAWLDLRGSGLGDDPAAVLLQRGRVALSPGPDFGRPGRGFARLNFACSRDVLAAAVNRIAAVATGSRSA